MNMLVGGRHYPMSMMLFFKRAMRRLGHEVYAVGPFSGTDGSIPWPGGPSFPQYVDKPEMPLPEALNAYPVAPLLRLIPEPDMVWSFDAGFRLMGHLEGKPSVLYGTDPHAIDYRPYMCDYSHFFCAQNQVMDTPLAQTGGLWIPLAYDPEVHRCDQPIDAEHRPIDVCFIGVMGHRDDPGNPYRNRIKAIDALREAGLNVYATTGLIFEECTSAYNSAKIAFNWSSSWDLPMRLWEGAAYGCCVLTNRLPGLEGTGFVESGTCSVFDDVEDCVDLARQLVEKGWWREIAQQGHEALKGETYDARIAQMMEVICGSGM